MLPNRIVTVGASAGGVESLTALVASLPPDLNAAMFVVLHIPPNYASSLPQILNKKSPFRAVHPANGVQIAEPLPEQPSIAENERRQLRTEVNVAIEGDAFRNP